MYVCARAYVLVEPFMLMVILEIGIKISTGCITVFSSGMGTCRIFKRKNASTQEEKKEKKVEYESISVPKWNHFS